MSAETILEMKGIRKIFPGVLALDDVDLEVRAGEVHILLGENGAGKSTLVKILSGAHMPSSGEIRLFGKPVSISSPRNAQEFGIGIIYQELSLVPSLTAAENIYLGREKANAFGVIRKVSLLEGARALLADLGLHIDCDVPVRNFGIAQRQMVEVARALSLDARILIMDEPTSALSQTEIRQLFDTVRKLKSVGVSVIYISHRMEEIFEIGDRVTVLRDGKHVGTRNICDTSTEELVRMMVNRELASRSPGERPPIGEEVLRVENLSTKGGLNNINFSLHRGEILGISGLLGSGRTELARAIFGVDRTETGQVYIKGKQQKISSPRAAIRQNIGFLTEDRRTQGLVLSLSVKENISLASLDTFSRLGMINIRQEAEEALAYTTDLRIKTPGVDQKALHLSGGNQQKVVLAKWLCSKAEIFIFDEPTRGIDVGSKAEIYQIMKDLTRTGVAIIMISSELPEILSMSDRILIMHQHTVAAELSATEASPERIMQYALGA